MKNVKKIVAILLMGLSIGSIIPKQANAEWKKDKKGWWYTHENSWVTGWNYIDGKWYYFDQEGYMTHNTIIDGNSIGADGAVTKIGVGTLTKKDFDYEGTDNKGILGGCKNIVDFFYAMNYVSGWGTYYVGATKDEKGIENGIINGNIEIGKSTLKEVIKKYGETEIKPVNSNDTFYKYSEFLKNPEKKCLIYSYYEDVHRFNVRFYFDSSDTLVFVAYTINESNFPKNENLAEMES